MVNESTGAQFGPQDGLIESVPENEPRGTFYVVEKITEKVVDTHTEEDADGSQFVVAEEEEHVRERLFGPFVQEVADDEAQRAKDRFRSLALPGHQEVSIIPADAETEAPQQDPVPAATEATVTDVLNPDAGQSPEVGGEVENTATDTIPDKAAGDAPSWSVTTATVPTSDQEDVPDGSTTNPPLEAPAGNPNPDAEPVPVPSAPDSDPNTVDAITGSSTAADDTTVDETAPPVAPSSPSVADGPADGAPLTGTVADTEPVIPDAPATIPVEATQGDSGADLINEDAPLNLDGVAPVDPPVESDGSQQSAPTDSSETSAIDSNDSSTVSTDGPVSTPETPSTSPDSAPSDVPEADATGAHVADPEPVDDQAAINAADQSVPGQG